MDPTPASRSQTKQGGADLISILLSLCIIVGAVGVALLMWAAMAGLATPLRAAAIACTVGGVLGFVALSWVEARKRGCSMSQAARRSVSDALDVVVELLPW